MGTVLQMPVKQGDTTQAQTSKCSPLPKYARKLLKILGLFHQYLRNNTAAWHGLGAVTIASLLFTLVAWAFDSLILSFAPYAIGIGGCFTLWLI